MMTKVKDDTILEDFISTLTLIGRVHKNPNNESTKGLLKSRVTSLLEGYKENTSLYQSRAHKNLRPSIENPAAAKRLKSTEIIDFDPAVDFQEKGNQAAMDAVIENPSGSGRLMEKLGLKGKEITLAQQFERGKKALGQVLPPEQMATLEEMMAPPKKANNSKPATMEV